MPDLNEAFAFILKQGVGPVWRVLRSTLRRDQLDRPFRRMLAARQASSPRHPGRLLQAQTTESGALFSFEQADLEVLFLAEDLVRLSWSPGVPPLPYALAKTSWEPVPLVLEGFLEAGKSQPPPDHTLTLRSSRLQVQISADGSTTFTSDGRCLHQDLAPFYRLEDAFQQEIGPAWSISSALQPEEALFGLGEHVRSFNLRGSRHRLWNTDPGGSYGPQADPIYMPLPVIMGLHNQGSYLIFYENPFPADFSCDPPGKGAPQCHISFEGGMLRYYVCVGQPAELLQRYTELTGRAGLPPLWSLGYHQSRWGYPSAAEIRAVVAGFKEHNLPLSAVSMDIDYMHGYRVFTVDPQRFPDLPGLASELAEQGIHLVTIIDPGVKVDPRYTVYQTGVEKGCFCREPDGQLARGVVWPGWAVFPDFTDPQVRLWWGEHYRILLEAGIHGIWHDMNEPPSFSAWGEPRLSLRIRHALEGRGGTHHEAHNLYGLLMNRAGWEAQRRLRPDRRPFLLSRSGWAGQQRYAWNWTADTEASWDGLRMTIGTVLSTGLSGQPYNGPDIGGFSGNPDGELYLRWFQLAAFLPFFRTHSATGTQRREPWVYGEPFTSIVRSFLQLRLRLLPYLYTLAWQASQSGAPLVRPLFWLEPDNPALWVVDDAFLLGENLLVAPVTQSGQKERSVILPPGEWVDFWDGSRFMGSGPVTLPVTLERIPLLVRAGSILPLAAAGWQPGRTDLPLQLHVYLPQDRSTVKPSAISRLYSDAGDGYGDSRLDRFELQAEADSWQLQWENQGDYPFPYSALQVYWHDPSGIQVQDWTDLEKHRNKPWTSIITSLTRS